MTRIKGNADQGGMAATAGFFIGFAAVALFGITASKIKEVMNISPVLIGFLISAPALSGSLLRIPFAAWVDTTGGRKPFLVLLLLSILGMAGLYYVISNYYPTRMTTQMYPVLLLLGVLCGSGIATFSVGIGQVSYWFPQKRQGSVLGLYAGLGNLAPGIFSLILPFALKAWNLAGCYLAWLIFLCVGTFFYFLMGRNAWYFQLLDQGLKTEEAKKAAQGYGQEIFPKGNILESLKVSSGRWKNWALVAIYFTTFGGFIALTAWFPTYWKSLFQLTTVMAGTLTALYSISASGFRVLGGNISDRWGGERTLLLALCVMFLGAVLMTQSTCVVFSVVCSLILALGMGFANAATFKLVPQEIPDAVGGAAGWVGGLGAFGGFTFPPLLGFIVKTQGEDGYTQGFFIFAALAVVSILLVILLQRSKRHKK